MRRLVLGASLGLGLLVGLVPARADFHPACDPFSAAEAHVDLSYEGGGYDEPSMFRYAGHVTCPKAQSIAITLVLTTYDLESRAWAPADDTAAVNACSLCDELETTGEALDPPIGVYRVEMDFTVRGPTTRPESDRLEFQASRRGDWLWTGVGQPLPFIGPP